ncbi:MAG: radical SAM protein [Clostridia bacterium]|nr:radical SAM protein [Clostridia bacterium]
MTTLICSVTRSSFHDGPGLRSVVYFKGCPLKCAWCHNPECISFEQEELHHPEKCIGCGRCKDGCFSGAKELCGREVSPQDLLSELLLDKPYFGTDGGVTLSGGEPLAHAKYIKKLLPLLENEDIGCAIETSLVYFDADILSRMKCVMADLKIWDSDIHERYTGIKNDGIKKNFQKLDKLGIPIIARTPVIPGVDQQIDKISEFLHTLSNVKKYELLKYHPLGADKYASLGKTACDFGVLDENYFKEMQKYAFDIR